MIYDHIKSAEDEFHFDSDLTKKKLQEYVDNFILYKEYDINIVEDISEYISFQGIRASFLISAGDLGRFYYQNENKRVVLISRFAGEPVKYKVVSLHEVNEDSFNLRRSDDADIAILKEQPIRYYFYLRVKIMLYIIPISFVIFFLYWVIFNQNWRVFFGMLIVETLLWMVFYLMTKSKQKS